MSDMNLFQILNPSNPKQSNNRNSPNHNQNNYKKQETLNLDNGVINPLASESFVGSNKNLIELTKRASSKSNVTVNPMNKNNISLSRITNNPMNTSTRLREVYKRVKSDSFIDKHTTSNQKAARGILRFFSQSNLYNPRKTNNIPNVNSKKFKSPQAGKRLVTEVIEKYRERLHGIMNETSVKSYGIREVIGVNKEIPAKRISQFAEIPARKEFTPSIESIMHSYNKPRNQTKVCNKPMAVSKRLLSPIKNFRKKSDVTPDVRSIATSKSSISKFNMKSNLSKMRKGENENRMNKNDGERDYNGKVEISHGFVKNRYKDLLRDFKVD